MRSAFCKRYVTKIENALQLTDYVPIGFRLPVCIFFPVLEEGTVSCLRERALELIRFYLENGVDIN